MATSDLIELLKDPVAWKHDADTERRLCDQIVAQLDDSSSDVSSLAVKWWGFHPAWLDGGLPAAR